MFPIRFKRPALLCMAMLTVVLKIVSLYFAGVLSAAMAFSELNIDILTRSKARGG